MRARRIVILLAAAASGLAVAQSDAADLDEPTLEEEAIPDDTGPSRFMAVRLGGGIEGHTGDLNDVTTVGPTWGLTVDVTPWRAFNVELGYTGATAEVEDAIAPGDQGLTSGPDIIRNGAHAALTVGPPTAVQPYALAGLGVDYYRLRGDAGGGFENDVATSLPLGVGVRGDLGRFSADLRVTYSALFGDTFAGQTDNGFGDGRVAGALQLGGTF